MFEALTDSAALSALFQVIMIDLVLAGDNAIVIGLAAAGLPAHQRGKAIFIGIAAATVLRIILAGLATQLLAIIGLLLAGGVLLLWVSWKMWRELRHTPGDDARAASALEAALNATGHATGHTPAEPKPLDKTFSQAAWQIVIADLSMSLDNVLAVGGAAREHPWVLIFGLALSIALMAFAAAFIARALQKYRWIGFAGLAVIVYVSLEMIYRGAVEVMPSIASTLPGFLAPLHASGAWWLVLAGFAAAAVIVAAVHVIRRRPRARS